MSLAEMVRVLSGVLTGDKDTSIWNWKTIGVLISGLFICHTTASMIYNVYFHPLADFPGPFFGRSSIIWRFIHMTIGDSHLCIAKLHRELGPIIRISPNELSFASVESIHTIYGQAPGKPPFRRGSYYMMLHSGFKKPNVVSEIDQDRHRELRRIMLPAFSQRALQEQEAVMSGMVDKWLKLVSQEACPKSNGVNIGRWYALDAIDILGQLAFGESFQAVETGRLDTRLNISINPYVITLIDNLRHFDIVVKLVKLLLPSSLLYKNPNAVFSREQAERRLALGDSRQDFVFPLVQKVQNGEMDKEEMASNMFVFTVAGQDTSVMSLLAITYFLLHNPGKLNRFVSEIRSSFSSYSDINTTKTQQLRYVQAVINESLRMIPPAPSGLGLPRVSPGFELHGRYIPPNVEVFTAPWSLTHDPQYWSDPMEFKPERWLDPNSKDIKETSQPFSIGPTLCIGKSFSLMEINLIVAKMFWKYDLELINKDFDWVCDGRVHAGWWWPKLFIRFHPREDVASDE